jgi:hypothetical protein
MFREHDAIAALEAEQRQIVVHLEGKLAQQVQQIGLAQVLAPDRGDAPAQVRLGGMDPGDVAPGFDRRHLVDLLLQYGLDRSGCGHRRPGDGRRGDRLAQPPRAARASSRGAMRMDVLRVVFSTR